MKYKYITGIFLFSILFLFGSSVAKASVLGDSFINLLNKKSMNAVGSLRYESMPQVSSSAKGQPTAKQYANVSLQSTQDFLTPGAIKSDQILSLDTNFIPLKSTLEMRLIGDTFYIKIPIAPYETFMPSLTAYKGKWIRFGKEDVTALAKDMPDIQSFYDELVSANNKPVAGLAQVNDFIKKYSSVITEKKIGSRTTNGIAQDKYSLTLNTKALIAKLTSELKPSMGTASYNYQIKDMKDSIALFPMKNGTFYVGKKDHMPYELSFTIQQLDTMNHKVISTSNLDFTFSNFGSHFDGIIAPTSFTTATEFYNNVIKKSLDAQPQISNKSMEKISKNGDTLAMNYTGRLTNGTVFDSNIDPKFGHVEPFVFTLGAGQVIKGWDEGLVGMKIGEKKTLTIPPEKAYGSNGAGSSIPPNSTLIFDVELVAIK